MGEPADHILREMDVVTDFAGVVAPIALVGMWFGRLWHERPPDVSWDVVVSGTFHARLRKMKIRGFVPADRPIHTEAEAERLLSTDTDE